LRSLANVDYFKLLDEDIFEELVYMLRMEVYDEGAKIYKANTKMKKMYIIADGEISMKVKNGFTDVTIDILYSGCQLGAFTVLRQDEMIMSAVAKSKVTVLSLSHEFIQRFREINLKFDEAITMAEDYVEQVGLPYCDYLIYRRNKTMTPKDKFIKGVSRIVVINKSQGAGMKFFDLLNKAAENAEDLKE
jgi:hypothetical protein